MATRPAAVDESFSPATANGSPAGRYRGEPTTPSGAPQQNYSLTVLLLFGSIGLNIYLFWITWDTYNRYQDLLGDMRSSRHHRDAEMSVA